MPFSSLNPANRITLARMVLVVPFIPCVLQRDNVWAQLSALILFVVALATDYLDGAVARRSGQVTRLGQVLDPLADKLLLTAAFVCFVEIGVAPAWMVVVIIAREFLITGLRVLSASHGDVIPASLSGKAKTWGQSIAAVTTLVLLTLRATLIRYTDSASWEALQEHAPRSAKIYLTYLDQFHLVTYWLFFAATVLSVASGLHYLIRARHLLRDEPLPR